MSAGRKRSSVMNLFGAKKKKKAKKGTKKNDTPSRRLARRVALVLFGAWAMLCGIGGCFVSHPLPWLQEKYAAWPSFVTGPLSYFGDRTILVTDGLGLTGHDAVYDPDDAAPSGAVFYAGAPRRRSDPAPADIRVLDRGEFAVGYSPSLGHPVWAAYHIPVRAAFEVGKRPAFRKDPEVTACPRADVYTKTGYDRGHMVPNHAIVTRFGAEMQKKTFYMTNVSPQSPSLNRGPWRFLERAAADLWTRAYGEIWVMVGTLPGAGLRLADGAVDVPSAFWQIIAAQTEEGLRILCFRIPQKIPYGAFPVHNIVTLAELEKETGLEFFPDMPEFLKRPVSTDLPTRLWPVKWYDIIRLCWLRLY